MIENPTNTAISTDKVRGTRNDCSRLANGARTKLNRIAKATGTRISLPKYNPVTINVATARLIRAVPGGCARRIGEVISAKFVNPRRPKAPLSEVAGPNLGPSQPFVVTIVPFRPLRWSPVAPGAVCQAILIVIV